LIEAHDAAVKLSHRCCSAMPQILTGQFIGVWTKRAFAAQFPTPTPTPGAFRTFDDASANGCVVARDHSFFRCHDAVVN
tara:strand:+ start:9328 stop:9564 length:237 start_codon:yes stop_codon:yes gene_type:complete